MNLNLMLNVDDVEKNKKQEIEEPPVFSLTENYSENKPLSFCKNSLLDFLGFFPYSKPSIFSYWQYPALIRQALGKDIILSYLEEFSTREAVYAVGKALFTPYVSLLENNPDQCLFHASTSEPIPFMVEFELEKYSFRLRAACQFYRNFIGNPLNKNAI